MTRTQLRWSRGAVLPLTGAQSSRRVLNRSAQIQLEDAAGQDLLWQLTKSAGITESLRNVSPEESYRLPQFSRTQEQIGSPYSRGSASSGFAIGTHCHKGRSFARSTNRRAGIITRV